MSLRPAPQRKIVYMLNTYVDKGFLLEKKKAEGQTSAWHQASTHGKRVHKVTDAIKKGTSLQQESGT